MKTLLLTAGFILFSSCSTSNFSLDKISVERKRLNLAWIKNLDPKYESGNLPIALHSPLISDGILYVGHNSGYFNAYELSNGREIFSEYDGSTYHSSPISYKDQIIYGTVQGRVISRENQTGKLKYSVDLGAPIETKGTVYQGRILFQLRNHQIFCLDVETGKILWAYKKSITALTTLQRASIPVVYKDKVIVGFADGTLIALSLDEGNVLYEIKLSSASKFVDVDNQAVVLGDKVYISSVSGFVTLLDVNTGKILRKSDFEASREPKVVGDNLLFGTAKGDLVLTDKNLNVLQNLKVSKSTITNIGDFRGNLLITTNSKDLYLVDGKDFHLLETYNLGHAYSAVFGAIVNDKEYSAFISSRNRLYVFH